MDYTDYGSKTVGLGTLATFNSPAAGGLTFGPVSSQIDLRTFEVTGRLNWRFDWGGPVAARY